MVESAQGRTGRGDLVLSVATPDRYPVIEALSRSAPRREIFSPLTADLIAWFADRNPCGRGFVVTASDAGSGRLVGYFLFYPWLLSRRDTCASETHAFLFVHLYVAPESRRRGVFRAMTGFGLDLVEQLGVGMVYTIPNPRSTPGFLKFGHQHAGDLLFWIRPALPGWGWGRAGLGRVAGVQVERRRRFDAAWQPDPRRDLPESTLAWNPRHADLLDWRFVDRPEGDYEIRYLHRGRVVGYLVTRRMRIRGLRALVVCDMWLDGFDPDAFAAGLEDASRSGTRVDIAVAFGGSSAPGYRQALRHAGFVVCPSCLQPQPVSVIGCGVGDGPHRLGVPPVAAWHLTPMDWDVF